jgi:hypothetical protein
MAQVVLDQAIQRKLSKPLLQVSQVSKCFWGKRILTEIDFEVAEHELGTQRNKFRL